jgi:hypothetical protein
MAHRSECLGDCRVDCLELAKIAGSTAQITKENASRHFLFNKKKWPQSKLQPFFS